jgi:hypothetical protein
MSHFTECLVDFQQSCEGDLVAALESVFGKGHVEVHEEGAPLRGYMGDDRSELSASDPNYAPKCHIIIRRRHVGSASNDVGYRRLPNGKYAAYISEYDQHAHFDGKRQDKVAQGYAVNVHERLLKKKNFSKVTKTVDENGVVRIKAVRY